MSEPTCPKCRQPKTHIEFLGISFCPTCEPHVAISAASAMRPITCGRIIHPLYETRRVVVGKDRKIEVSLSEEWEGKKVILRIEEGWPDDG